MGIIQSLADNDSYKFTMQQAVLHQHPTAVAKYRFVPRTKNAKLPSYKDVQKHIDDLCLLRFNKRELGFFNSHRFIKEDYVELECDFIMTEEQINGFIEALEEGKRKLEKLKKG